MSFCIDFFLFQRSTTDSDFSAGLRGSGLGSADSLVVMWLGVCLSVGQQGRSLEGGSDFFLLLFFLRERGGVGGRRLRLGGGGGGGSIF